MNQEAKALIRQGALTTIGALGVYGLIALTVQVINMYARKKAAATPAAAGCGCGGH